MKNVILFSMLIVFCISNTSCTKLDLDSDESTQLVDKTKGVRPGNQGGTNDSDETDETGSGDVVDTGN